MAWFADLTPCDHLPLQPTGGAWLLAVGWLEREHAFPCGEISRDHYQKLNRLLADPWQPFVSMGVHGCTLCQFEPEASDTANLFVPGQGVIYVCPKLIRHYINAHHYQPPPVFLEAVLRCPDTRTMEYKRLLLASGGGNLIPR